MTTNTPKNPLRLTDRKPVLYIAGALLFAVIAIKYFVELVVMPAVGNYFDVYVPAKGGGRSYFLDMNEFNTVSLVAIAVAIGLTLLVGLFIKLKRDQGTVFTVFLYCLLAASYIATILGNGVYQLWGTFWSIVAVVGSIVAVFSLEVWLMKSAWPSFNSKRLRKDK